MDTQGLMAALSEPFPPHAIEQREGAFGKMLDYVATETVIRRLNRVCPEWSYRKTGHEWTDPVNWTDKNGKPRTSRTLVVFGELTIPQLGTRSGTGVQVVEDGRSGEDLIKGASSDCLKNCAKLFNVGIDLYGPDLEAGEMPDDPRDFASTRGIRTPPKPNLPARARTEGQNTVPVQQPANLPPSDLATPRQHGFIRAIAREFGMSDEELADELDNIYNKTLQELDRRDASAYIERLQSRRNVTDIAS